MLKCLPVVNPVESTATSAWGSPFKGLRHIHLGCLLSAFHERPFPGPKGCRGSPENSDLKEGKDGCLRWGAVLLTLVKLLMFF